MPMQHSLPAPLTVRRIDRRTATWTVLLMALGATVALPLGQRGRAQPVTREAEREPAAQSLAWLEAEQRQLKDQIAASRAAIAEGQQRQVRDRAALDDVQAALRQQQALAGLVALVGPGVTVTLGDSTAAPVSAAAANDYIIHDTDVRDVVSVLWSAGAEAIAVNDERLVANSSIVCVGTVILINDTRLSPPFSISAIGPAEALGLAIDAAPHLAPLRRRAKDYGLLLKVAPAERVDVAAYRGTLTGLRAGSL
jgi:uncharacterized protein YlxW (UPF0749 family)